MGLGTEPCSVEGVLCPGLTSVSRMGAAGGGPRQGVPVGQTSHVTELQFLIRRCDAAGGWVNGPLRPFRASGDGRHHCGR